MSEGHLAAELAIVAGVLRDLHLLHLLTKGGTITGSALADDPNLKRARVSPPYRRAEAPAGVWTVCAVTAVLGAGQAMHVPQRRRTDVA